MYSTGLDPFSMAPLFVEKDPRQKERQKKIITDKPGQGRKKRAYRK
jgi:hypothetical protein